MQPLQRQETHSSLRSWWSDSNSMLRDSPTVNLHAMAKPLMRLMYHRQALGFIEENRGAPLSAELLEIYSSYLSCRYVPRRTRRLILDHLRLRASRKGRYRDRSGQDAQEILYSPVLDQILYIPGPSDPGCSRSIEALIAALMASNFGCDWDVGHLQASDSWEVKSPETEAAVSEVTHVLRNQEGPAAAQALLESANASVKLFTLDLIERIERLSTGEWIIRLVLPHDLARVGSEVPVPLRSPVSFIYKTISTVNWAKLLSDENDSAVQFKSMIVLLRIAKHPGGSRAIVAANILDNLQHSFDSKRSSRLNDPWAWCQLIESLTQYDFTIPHILHANVIDPLVCEACRVSDLFDHTVSALIAISRHPQGAAAVLAAMSEMDSKFFNDFAVTLLNKDQTFVFTQEVCGLISNLAKDRNSASVLRRSSHLAAALENLLRSGPSGSGWSDERKFFVVASSLIQLHKWSGPEKLGNIVAAIRQGAATAKISLEHQPELLEEIREAETFQL